MLLQGDVMVRAIGRSAPVVEQLDLNPTEAIRAGVFANLVCARYRSADRAADVLGTRAHGLAKIRLGARHCRCLPADVIDALARYGGCTRADLLAGKATLPEAEAA